NSYFTMVEFFDVYYAQRVEYHARLVWRLEGDEEERSRSPSDVTPPYCIPRFLSLASTDFSTPLGRRLLRQEKLRSGDKLLGMLAATLWSCGDFPVSPRGCSSASPGVSECDWESGDRLASDRAGLNMILRRELE
ncbi:hypothetical protein FOZ63_021953, partial [Perkinsus olseni]